MTSGFRLSPQQRIIAWRLSEGRCISVDEIHQALYSDDMDGGPLNYREWLTILMWRVGVKLRSVGISIDHASGRGWYVEDPKKLRDELADELARDPAIRRWRLPKEKAA